LLSRGVFVEYLGDRLDMFLEGLLLFGVMAGEELSTILSSLIEPCLEKVTCSLLYIGSENIRLIIINIARLSIRLV